VRPPTLPGVEYFAALPCGTRAKYIGARCRCLRCRVANAGYEAARKVRRAAGDTNGLVPAAPARAHLLALSRAGVSRTPVHEACDVSRTVLAAIRRGTRTQIREATARRILAVTSDAVADHAVIGAGQTKRQLRVLLHEGFTRGELARRLGSRARTPHLQIMGPRVLARTAAKVDRFYRLVMAEA